MKESTGGFFSKAKYICLIGLRGTQGSQNRKWEFWQEYVIRNLWFNKPVSSSAVWIRFAISEKEWRYLSWNIFLLNLLTIIHLICDSFLTASCRKSTLWEKTFPSLSRPGRRSWHWLQRGKPNTHFSGKKISSSFPSTVLPSTPFTDNSFPNMWQPKVVSRKS